MKKKLAAALASVLALTLVMGMSVFAAGSSTTSNTTASSSSSSSSTSSTSTTTTATTAKAAAADTATEYANVAVPGVIIDGVAVSVAPTVAPVKEAEVAAAQAQATAAIGSSAKVLQMVDVSLPAGTSFGKVTLTFTVSGVVEGQKIYVLHEKSAGVWETITPDAVGNSVVTATFTSLSPIAIVAADASAKTGETMPLAAVAAVICLAGIAVCTRKKLFV